MSIMKDSNGIEMKTGMIVEIKDAYFKNDNGLWFIENTPGDPTWSGSDYSLKKLCKNGKVSTARRNIAFWPLCAFCSDRRKNYEAHDHNEKHATITVREDITTEHVAEHFAKKIPGLIERLDWDRRMGNAPSVLATEERIIEHYQMLADAL